MKYRLLVIGLVILSIVVIVLQIPSLSLVHVDAPTEEEKESRLDFDDIEHAHEEPDSTTVPITTPIETQQDTPLSYGIAFVTYGSALEKTKEYTSLAQRAALLYRQHSPNLKIALLTSHPASIDNTSSPFTDIITIPHWMVYDGRQWLTRTQAIRTLLPYDLTLFVDADTIACGDISIPLQEILASPEQMKYTIATANHKEHRYSPDNGIMLFNNKAPGFQEIMDVWFNHHIKLGIKSDDQQSLKDSSFHFLKRNDVHMGFLHPTISCRWHPGQNQTWSKKQRDWDQTLTLNGFVYILHMKGIVPGITNDLCNIVNKEPNRTRVMVWKNHKKYPLPTTKKELHEAITMAYSKNECQRLLEGYCYNMLQWEKLKTKKYITTIKF